MLVYAATIFLSAFLLFQVQPLIAKYILPWFGGSAAVWSAALLFFQVLLLAGYWYAHLLIRYLAPRRQLLVHGALLVASLATLPIIPSGYWKPAGGSDPTLRIMLLLGATIGLPYMLLSSTSPLLQAWYVRKHRNAVPYRLFALSNFGSMLALLTYPSLVEPRMALSSQAYTWSAGFVAFALACAAAAWSSLKANPAPETSATPREAPPADAVPGPPRASTVVLWIALAACASALLLGTTSHLTQNISPIPLLWVVPLSIYLLSFILCFESDRMYQRWIFLPFGATAIALYSYGMRQFENNADVVRILIPALCAALFVCCMVCHGELARRKPHPRYLTYYFLMISAGGALGGVFVAFIAPNLFSSYLELPVAVAGVGVLMSVVLWHDQKGAPRPVLIRAALVGYAFAIAVYLGYNDYQENRQYFLTARNFYGVLRIRDDVAEGVAPSQRVLIHGTINHGTEVKAPDAGRIPTSYFGRTSGINRAIRTKGEKGPIRIGILGLGAGVTASLARQGDTIHYYEINPLVFEIAKAQFSFWNACPADKQLFLGDGRLVLESIKESENLDFLAMDAFTSDAVPVHLLTREAYRTYLRHLKPDGLLAINISNRYLDLEPIVARAAEEVGFSGVVIADESYEEAFYVSSTWVILARDPNFFNHPNFQDTYVRTAAVRPEFREWTDDYSNIMLLNDTLRKFVQVFD
jgi:SAM-dependent methyltransferase